MDKAQSNEPTLHLMMLTVQELSKKLDERQVVDALEEAAKRHAEWLIAETLKGK